MDNNSLCNSLMRWLERFPGRSSMTVNSLTDGVVMAGVLNQIAPEYFNQNFMSKIKTEVGENWRLKVSNLRKIHQGILDYYQEQLGQSINHFPVPDLTKIAEHENETELGRLLQLILGCAVNCEQKQLYIEAIMGMEESVQAVIMGAIQELMIREGSPGAEGLPGMDTLMGPASFHPHLKTVLEQLETVTAAKEEVVQRCHELEIQVSVLLEEKSNLKSDKEVLENRLETLEVEGEVGSSTLRYKDLKKKIDDLQDELYKIETSRDEMRSRIEVLERENQELVVRNDQLTSLADQARALKDEVDTLSDMREKIAVYEGNVEVYKKKLEELSDLKRQVKVLEEKNSDYMQHNMELEEEVKKSGTWRPQLDMYKKQVAELHQKLAEEAKAADRKDFDNKKLLERIDTVIQEKERVMMERDGLKENLEELKCQVSTMSTSSDTVSRPPSDLSDADMLEIIPHEIREKLVRLQHENKVLKEQASTGETTSQVPVLQNLLSDLQDRHTSSTQENRQLNQRIIELESELEELRQSRSTGPSSSPPMAASLQGQSVKSTADARRITELEHKLENQRGRISALEESLAKKESDMAAMEERYKKYLGKAKSVIKTLDPNQNPGLVPDLSTLRAQLHEKDRTIENLKEESKQARQLREVEEKLITTAFHNYSMQIHRQMVRQRLSNMDQEQSFLARQRQANTRRVNNNNSNIGNSEFYDY